jgi:extracellular elastinolytic metalloproteinase
METSISTVTPTLSAQEAVLFAASSLDLGDSFELKELTPEKGLERAITFKATPGLSQDVIPAKLAYRISKDTNSVSLTWQLVLRLHDNERWLNMWVSAKTGTVLAQSNWIAGASFSVFDQPRESPVDSIVEPFDVYSVQPMTLVTINDTKWLNDGSATYTTTRGNNVIARLDRNGNNTGSLVDATSLGPSTFDYSRENITSANPDDYSNAAVTNLFYWNNIMHDILYEYGFDEAAGNFQESNFGLGGFGGDAVNADAQVRTSIGCILHCLVA